jgi:GDPmannose 4,6-dehydratase
LTWQGTGLDERGLGPDGRALVAVSPRYFRPSEVEHLRGDATKARRELGWSPTVTFESLVQMMTDADLSTVEGQ